MTGPLRLCRMKQPALLYGQSDVNGLAVRSTPDCPLIQFQSLFARSVCFYQIGLEGAGVN